jgi:leucyl aminopeptidase (aminopeptidase T)
VSGDFTTKSWARLASSVLKNALGLHRGQNVVIDTFAKTLPLAELLSNEARRLGIRPTILYIPDRLFEPPAGACPSDAFAISRAELGTIAACDGYVFLPPGPEALKGRDRLPSAHRRALSRRQQDWNRSLALHSVPTVYLLAGSVTESAARHFGVNLEEWRRESFRASAVAPSRLRREARPFANRLRQGNRITITHPNGTHLELGLVGRQPVIDDGMVDRQDVSNGLMGTVIPAGSMVVAIDERVAEGRLISNLPSRYSGRAISGIAWTFRKGRLDRYEIEVGKSQFEGLYRRAGRERDRPALLYIGLNPEIHEFPRAEDQALGTLCLGIGHNDDFGGRTRGKFREYALLRGADLFIDDRPVLRSGRRT